MVFTSKYIIQVEKMLDWLFGNKKSKEEEEKEKIFRKIARLLNDDDFQNSMLPPMFRGPILSGTSVDQLANGSGEFGFSPTNPIPCNGSLGEVTYLSRLLYGPQQEKVFFHRLGSIQGNIDKYELMTLSGKRAIVYLDMYHPRKSRLAPKGFSLQPDTILIRGINQNLSMFPHNLHQAIMEFTKRSIGFPLADSDAKKFDS